ncbi:MAG: 3-dehydroquinate synthase [Balneolaceae bacterium]
MSDFISVSTSVSDSYNIHIGDDLNAKLREITARYSSKKAYVVVDEVVLQHHRELFEPVLGQKFPHLHIFEVPSGESSKSGLMFNKLLDFILKNGVERGTPLFAIGGGVTGDLAGFAAATVLRGIPLIHIPTTLLAMVDSSIGGKTGINHSTGKNLIGSFYQPDAVLADVRYLETLPREEWVNGLSEVLKYGLIHSPEIFDEVQVLIDQDNFTNALSWISLIKKSAQIKADVVSGDVLEGGKRAFLNFGHTFAHVIEREGNYQEYSHGEAVFAGMVAAVHASNNLGAQIGISNLLNFKPLYNFSLAQINNNVSGLVDLMRRDKKVKDEQINLVLLHEAGKPHVYKADNVTVVEDAWKYILKTFEK